MTATVFGYLNLINQINIISIIRRRYIKHLGPHFQALQVSLKILHCASYFQLDSRCLEMSSNTPRKWGTKTEPKWPRLYWRNRYRVKANQIFNTGLAFPPFWSRKRKRVDDIAGSFGASLTPNTLNTGYAGWSRISWGSVYPWGPDEVLFTFGFNLKIELNRWK